MGVSAHLMWAPDPCPRHRQRIPRERASREATGIDGAETYSDRHYFPFLEAQVSTHGMGHRPQESSSQSGVPGSAAANHPSPGTCQRCQLLGPTQTYCIRTWGWGTQVSYKALQGSDSCLRSRAAHLTSSLLVCEPGTPALSGSCPTDVHTHGHTQQPSRLSEGMPVGTLWGTEGGCKDCRVSNWNCSNEITVLHS